MKVQHSFNNTLHVQFSKNMTTKNVGTIIMLRLIATNKRQFMDLYAGVFLYNTIYSSLKAI